MIRIPKVFHQIWFGGPMPDAYLAFAKTWRHFHAEWAFRLWTEENLFPLELQAYFDTAEEFCQKSDIARYEVLWRFGGIYLDCDFECIKSIEPLLDEVDAFLGYEDPVSVNNAIIGAVPRHPALAAMIDAVRRRFFLPGPAFFTTGPGLVTPLVKRFADIRLFPSEVFYPLFWTRSIDPVLTHAIHHYKTPKFERRLLHVSRPAKHMISTSRRRLICLPTSEHDEVGGAVGNRFLGGVDDSKVAGGTP